MSQPLIQRHHDWPGLVGELKGKTGYAWLNGVTLSLAAAVLAAPAAVACWIAFRMPQLARSARLSIVVIGAETTDAADHGRWYQVVPDLLETSCAIDVSLVGLELDPNFVSSAVAHAPERPACLHHMPLREFLTIQSAHVDAAFMFQPGLQKHRGWLAPDGFSQLLNSGIPVIGSSYEVDEYEMERWVLECYGYGVCKQPLLNPYSLNLGDEKTSIRWGRAMWSIESAPAQGERVDDKRLAALDNLTRMTMHSMLHVRTPAPGYGLPVELRGADGASRAVIHIADLRFVDRASGELMQLEGRQLKFVGHLPAHELDSYPGQASREIERAVWAAGVKSRLLLAGYPLATRAVDESQVARDMFETMRAKAVSLFH